MSSDYLFPSPQTSTSNVVFGDRWNYHVNRENRTSPFLAMVSKEGSTYYGYKSTGELVASGSDAYTVVNSTLNNVHTANGLAIVKLSPHSFDFANQSLNLLAKSNVAIIGSGMNMTTILNGAITNTGGVTTSNIFLKDMTINANSNRTNAANLQKVTDLRVESVKMMNSSTGFVFNWSQSDRLLADKCQFIEGGLTGAADNCAGGQITTTENESIFRNCYFEKTNSLGGGMLTTGGTGNLLVDGCQMWNKGTASTSYAAVSIENSFGVCKEIRIVNCRGFGENMGFQIGNNTTNQIERATIENCISTGVQSIYMAKQAIITNGVIYNSVYGYLLLSNTVGKLSNCVAVDTNKGNSGSVSDKGGCYGLDNTRLEISGLDVYGSNGFMPHGIRASSTALDTKKIYISDCNLVGPFTAAPLQLTNFLYAQVRSGSLVGTPSFITNTTLSIRDVEGYVTEAQGTGTITSAATSASVTHGLSYTPTASEISITFTENPTNTPRFCYILSSEITSTTFIVRVDSVPGASNLDFSWSVRRI